jgi:hypothetical protein
MIAGDTFGRLTLVERIATRPSRWRCRCLCGSEVVVRQCHLVTGHTRSCGCLSLETLAKRNREGATHGLSNSSEYRIWIDMIRRCEDSSVAGWIGYGARGIRVCERWKRFELFYADMGQRPSARHSIERRDNNGNYEPANCYWATRTEQARNKRNTRYVTINGTRMCVADIAGKFGIDSQLALARMRVGWSAEDAVSLPKGRAGVRATKGVLNAAALAGAGISTPERVGFDSPPPREESKS